MSRTALEVIALADCPSMEKLVLVTIAAHGDRYTGSGGYPSVRRIAQKAGIGQSTVERALNSLGAKKWLFKSPGKTKDHKSNVYTIHLAAIAGTVSMVGTEAVSMVGTVSTVDTDCIDGGDRTVSNTVSTVGNELTTEPKVNTTTSPSQGKPAKAPAPRKQQSAKPKPKKSPEPRQAELTNAIYESWTRLNPDSGFPWGKPEGSQLKLWLKKHPTVKLPQFETMLRNREQSEINPAEEPLHWIAKIGNFASGPLNQYNKPLTSAPTGGTNGSAPRETRTDRVKAAFREEGTDLPEVDQAGATQDRDADTGRD